MQRNNRSLVMTLIAVTLSLSAQIACQADAFHRAVINGRYHLDSTFATGYNVTAYSTFFAATGKTVYGGTVTISNDKIAVHAGVAKLTTDSLSILNIGYKHAMVTTTPFVFHGQVAYAVVEITKFTVFGQGGFKIIRASDGSMMAGSFKGTTYLQVPLEWGGVSIF